MLNASPAAPEFPDVIRASLAGLARNLAGVKNLSASDDMCRAVVSDALAGLAARDLHLLDQGDPHAATRAAAAVTMCIDRLCSFRDDCNGRLLGGNPLRLADFVDPAAVVNGAQFAHPVLGSGPVRIEPGRIIVVLNGVTLVLFHDNVVLHRNAEEGPAFSATAPGGQLLRALYLCGGVLHRPRGEGPAMLEFDAAGHCLCEGYYEHGKLHRDPKRGPACRTLLAEEGRERFEYFVEGKLHRDEADGPAWIVTSLRTGRIVEEGYYRRGECHRQGGPATIIRNNEGVLLFEAWFQHGKLHRDPGEGPAIICHDEDGRITSTEFWRDGEMLEDGADREART